MSASMTWRDRLESTPPLLLALVDQLGVPNSDLYWGEKIEPGKLVVGRQCDNSRLVNANTADLAALFRRLEKTCGNALTLELREGDLIMARATDTDLLIRIAQVQQSAMDPNSQIFVDVIIDKRELFSKQELFAGLPAIVDRPHLELYFFPQSLELVFAGCSDRETCDSAGVSLAQLEGDGLLGQTFDARRHGLEAGCERIRKLILFVAGADLSLNGERLAVVGGRFLPDWQSYVPKESPAMKPSEEMHERALARLNWTDLSLQQLTPLDLAVSRKLPPGAKVSAEAAAVERAIYRRLLDLCLLYTAALTRRRGTKRAAVAGAAAAVAPVELDDWTSTWSVGDHQTQVRWGADVPLPPGEEDSAFFEGVERFAQVVRRVYGMEGLATDRLHNFQGVLATMLQETPANENYPQVARLAGAIDSNEEWSWHSFCDGKLTVFFGRVRDLTALVDDTTERYRGQTQILVKSFLDNTLAAAGVVVAFFVGSLFKPDLNPDIVTWGIRIYAGYLIVFPGIIGLLNACSQFRHARRSFKNREFLFRQQLDEEAVDNKLRKEAQAAEKHFKYWACGIAVIYVVSFGLLLWAARILPGFLHSLAGSG